MRFVLIALVVMALLVVGNDCVRAGIQFGSYGWSNIDAENIRFRQDVDKLNLIGADVQATRQRLENIDFTCHVIAHVNQGAVACIHRYLLLSRRLEVSLVISLIAENRSEPLIGNINKINTLVSYQAIY